MDTDIIHFWSEAVRIWISGGWLMAPLLVLTVYIYYVGLELFLRLSTHYLVRMRANDMTDEDINAAFGKRKTSAGDLLVKDARSVEAVQRHFVEIRNEYLPVVNRRIQFLKIISSTGPLLGLLGTVTGMLSTFGGMVSEDGSKFENMISGISEALITTQSGLIISIPCFVLLALVIQRRNALERSLSSLERYNTRLALRQSRCPVRRIVVKGVGQGI